MYRIHNLLGKSDYIYISILFILSFSINWIYAKNGVFPIDSFYHYDPGYRIINGELPIKDYWVTTGIFVDFLEALFFYIFGAKWFSHILHSSIFNGLVAVLVYFLFVKLNLKKIFSFIFALSFGVLAYTSSGTPFVDHHATFLLLVGTIFLVLGIKTNFLRYWFLSPWFFGLSFLCKQVPPSYMIIVSSIILLSYLIIERNKKALYCLISSSILFLFFISLVIFYLDISFKDFYVQYILYPPSIGEGRLGNLKVTFNGIFNHYKFIIIPLLFIILFKIKNFKKDIFPNLLILSFVMCLIFHQILTKNQIYIYFIIPILFGILEREIYLSKFKLKKYISIFSLVCLLLITLKYHYRFNENKKFHELENTNFDYAIPADNLDKKLSGLLWVNPFFQGKPIEEISILKKGITKLSREEDEIMLLTHYLFLDSITKRNLNFPNRSFTDDGASMPLKENKYFNYYKNYLLDKIKNKDIKKVYYFKHENISQITLTDYLSSDCYDKSEDDIFFVFSIKCSK